LPQFLDTGGERVVTDREAAPDLVEQLLLGDELLGAFGQHGEHGGGPRRELGFHPVAPKLAGARVEPEPAERESPIRRHREPPSISRRNPGTRPGLAGTTTRKLSHTANKAAIEGRSPVAASASSHSLVTTTARSCLARRVLSLARHTL